jgi:lipopolysaccharide/colanic/teichoic acid biosynthesis glycosyltransferase
MYVAPMFDAALKRLMDVVLSSVLLILVFPIAFIIGITILIESSGGVFFTQTRVGLNRINFRLYKFRTMKPLSEQHGQLTVGASDSRITRTGKWLRRFKLDELPQLINVLKGDMSLVGPRPEVPKYVDLYTAEQLKVLSIKPGITDYASIKYFDENELLGKAQNPEQTYIHQIMPEKLAINVQYIHHRTLWMDFRIMVATALRIIGIKASF